MDYFHGASVFDIAQAYQQLEESFNVGGWLRERPSNQRRMESIGCQLHRIGYRDIYRFVDICASPSDLDDAGDDDVRAIYMERVMDWNLPADDELLDAINRTFVREWLLLRHPNYVKKP